MARQNHQQRSDRRPLAGDLVAQFERLAAAFAKLAAAEGVPIAAYHGARPGHFATLPYETQAKVLRSFSVYMAASSDVLANGGSLRDDSVFLWAMLKHLKLRPPSDMFGCFERGDVVEMYMLPEQVQVFRNLLFHKVCGYSLDDIMARPWWELYRRDERVTRGIMASVERLVQQPDPGVTPFGIGVHALEEIDSGTLYRFLVKQRWLGPVFDISGRVAAVVVVTRPIAFERRGAASAALDLSSLS